MKLSVFLKSPIAPFNLSSLQRNRMRDHFSPMQVEFCETREAFLASLPDAEAVVTWMFRAAWYAKASRLRWVCTPAAGTDWVDASSDGSVGVRHGRFHGLMMREAMLAMMLYFNHHFGQARRFQMQKRWQVDAQQDSRLLASQRVLFVGYGNIARHCAMALKPFGCAIVGLKRRPLTSEDPETGATLVPMDALEGELSRADHVVCILPGGPDTDALLGWESLKGIRPGAFLYNLGRGNCLPEPDLLRALDSGLVAGAGLDVFEEEPLPASSALWGRENVIVTPHSSCHYQEYLDLFLDELTADFDSEFRSRKAF